MKGDDASCDSGDTEDVKDVTTAANRAKQQPEEAQEQQPEEQQSQGEKIMSVKVAVMVLGMCTCSPLSGLFEFWGRAEEVLLEK